MVVVLPLIILLFFGLEFLRQVVSARMRAVEAARVLTWEALWHVREGNPSGTIRGDDQLQQDLRRFGLGEGLVQASAAAKKRTLGRLAADVKGRPSRESFPPKGVAALLSDEEATSGRIHERFRAVAASMIAKLPAELRAPLPADHFILKAFGILDGAALGSGSSGIQYGLHDLVAANTRWNDETRNSVYTARVSYEFRGYGLLKSLPPVRITESSSILSHPLSLKREDDAEELAALVGKEKDVCDSKGRLYDLWLTPNDPVAGGGYDIAPALIVRAEERADPRKLKCAAAKMKVLRDLLPWLGQAPEVKVPAATLKEYPERNLGEDAGNTADDEDGFGSGAGGPGGGPFHTEVGF